MEDRSLTMFVGSTAVASGSADALMPRLRELAAHAEDPVLCFDDLTGEQVDLDLREDGAAPVSAPAPERPRPGRPKLGVVAREVTLLPRHWEWLSAQPGGASVALRKLVEAARRENAESDRVRRAQEAAFRFMTSLAGNERGFEDAARALYAGDAATFDACIESWPIDVARYARRLADAAFSPGV